jgi:hypothetical protein
MGFAVTALVLSTLTLGLLSQGYVIDESHVAQVKYPQAFKEIEAAMKELKTIAESAMKEVTLEEDEYDNTRRSMFGHHAWDLEQAQGIVRPKQVTTLADPLTR